MNSTAKNAEIAKHSFLQRLGIGLIFVFLAFFAVDNFRNLRPVFLQ